MVCLIAKLLHGHKRLKAITYSAYGPPDVLQLKDVEKPVPTDDEVLIKVRAAEGQKTPAS